MSEHKLEKKPSSGQVDKIDDSTKSKRAKVDEDIGSGVKQAATEIMDPLPNPLKLRFVGFCGVDESFTDVDKYDWPSYIEWGVLFRPEKEGSLRFPKQDWVENFAKGKKHLAAHLCSSRCETFLNGDLSFVRTLHEKLGFRRFQINATKGNGVNSENLGPTQVHNIINAARELPNAEFIIQRNDETKALWEGMETIQSEGVPLNVSYLFDASVGRGVMVQEFPQPSNEHAKYGYAGGIKPDNVEHVLRSVAAHVPPNVHVWIDMESGIRESDDKFSSKKAWKVCQTVDELHAGKIIAFAE